MTKRIDNEGEIDNEDEIDNEGETDTQSIDSYEYDPASELKKAFVGNHDDHYHVKIKEK